MMKYLLVILFFTMTGSACIAQNPADNADTVAELIRRLNNSSVIITYNYFEELHLDSLATNACNRLAPSDIVLLFQALDQKNKTLIAHVLLTKNLEVLKAGLSYKYNYNQANDKIISTEYTYNGFTWQRMADGSIYINEEDIQKIKKYWEAKPVTKILLHNCGD